MSSMTGAAALAGALTRMGAARIYGIIGTSNLLFVDALCGRRDEIRYVSCRHEQVAASMADTEGRLTGRPGVALVHSGPGALNAMISVGNAAKDCSPMILISGAVKRRLAGSDGMLELDHPRVFSSLCKGTYRVDSAAGVPEVFSEAYRTCMSGVRGPVMIEVPEDVWTETADIDLSGMFLEADPPPPVNPEDAAAAVEMLGSARLPLILAGGGIAYSGAAGSLLRLAEQTGVPVATTGNGRGAIPETHPRSLGRAGFGGGNVVADKALESADAVLCLGCGLSDMTTYEYTLPVKAERIIIVDISGKVAPQAPPARVIPCDASAFLEEMLAAIGDRRYVPRPEWEEALAGARQAWGAMCEGALSRQSDKTSGARLMKELSGMLPDDTVVCVGAGTHLLYPMDFMPAERPLAYMSTVNFGSMGFGFAACIATKLIFPERSAIAVLGDGDFMMTLQDLETAVREEAAVKVFVMNDCQYRVLNIRQKLTCGGRIYGTEHGNPDFAALARTFGAVGYRIEKDSEVTEVLEKAVAETGPVVVDVLIDPDELPPLNLEASMRMAGG